MPEACTVLESTGVALGVAPDHLLVVVITVAFARLVGKPEVRNAFNKNKDR